MSTTEINSIIEYLTKNGLTPEDVENNGGYATLNYDSFWVDVCCATKVLDEFVTIKKR